MVTFWTYSGESGTTLNQLLSGHSMLNSHQSKTNKDISDLCDSCNVPEDLKDMLDVVGRDRMTFSRLHQLLSGHSKLNSHQSKIKT